MKPDYFLLPALAAAFAVRAWNISWGLPEIYEEATPFFKTWGFWNWERPGFDFNPHFFNYPALTFYLNFIGQAIHYVAGYVMGWYSGLDAYAASFRADPTPFIRIARFSSIGFDLGTVYIVDRLSRDIGPPPLRFVAIPLVMLNLLLIQQSHLVNVDTPLTFFTVLCIHLSRKWKRNQRIKHHVIIGIVVGLAAASKYTGTMLFLVLFLDRILEGAKTGRLLPAITDRRFYLTVAVGLLSFIDRIPTSPSTFRRSSMNPDSTRGTCRRGITGSGRTRARPLFICSAYCRNRSGSSSPPF